MGPKPLMQSFALPGSYAAATYEEFGGDPYASGYQSGYAGGYGGGAVRKTSAISSDTNSRDPKDLKSRVFVGNVNTQLVRGLLHT